MSGEQLSADDAWHTVRRYGLAAPARQRRSSGSATATASATPGRSACSWRWPRCRWSSPAPGWPARWASSRSPRWWPAPWWPCRRAAATRWSPRPSQGGSDEGSERGEVVVVLGLITAFAGRHLGVRPAGAGREPDLRHQARPPGAAQVRPRRAAHRDRRGGAGLGLLLIVAGEPFGEALEQVYHWGDAAETSGTSLRWPLGLAALVVAVTVLFRTRRAASQPGLSWLAVGAAVTVLVWLAGLRPARRCTWCRGRLRRDLRPADRGDGAAAVGQRHRDRAARRHRAGRAAGGGAGRPPGPAAAPTATTTASPTSSTSSPTRRPADPLCDRECGGVR